MRQLKIQKKFLRINFKELVTIHPAVYPVFIDYVEYFFISAIATVHMQYALTMKSAYIFLSNPAYTIP